MHALVISTRTKKKYRRNDEELIVLIRFLLHRWLHSSWFTNKFLGKCHKSLHDLAVSKTHRKRAKKRDNKRQGIFAKIVSNGNSLLTCRVYFFVLSLFLLQKLSKNCLQYTMIHDSSRLNGMLFEIRLFPNSFGTVFGIQKIDN